MPLSCQALLDQVLAGRGKMSNSEFELGFDRLKPLIDNLANTRLDTYTRLATTRQQVEYARRAVHRTSQLQRMFDLSVLNPNEQNSLFRFLSLGMDWNVGKVGRIKRTLDTQRETAASMLEFMTRTNVALHITNLSKGIKQVTDKLGIQLSKLDERMLGIRLIEEGSLLREMEALSVTQMSKQFNQQRVNTFTQWATNELGLDLPSLDYLIDLATQVSNAQDDIRIFAKALGLSVDKLTDLGYLHRSYTNLGLAKLEDIRGTSLASELDKRGIGTHPMATLERQFNFITPTTTEALIIFAELTGLTKGKLYETFSSLGQNYSWLQGKAADLSNAVQVSAGNVLEIKIGKSAKAADRAQAIYERVRKQTQAGSVERDALDTAYQAQDMQALSVAIRNALPNHDAVAVLDERSGDYYLMNWSATLEKFDATGDIIDLLSDPKKFTEYVMQSLTSDQVDNLIDSGILHKIPMSSVEVMELLNSKYNMGFDNLSQLMETDLMTASMKYTEGLKNAARQNAVFQVLTDGRAEAAGWIIPASSPELRKPEYSNWVTVGDKFNEQWINLTGSPPPVGSSADALLGQLGIPYKEAAELASSKVHPEVAALINQYISQSWNASVAGMAGHAVQTVAQDALRFGVAQGGLGYVNRNILETFFAASRHGFNPGRIKESFDYLRGLSRTNSLNDISDRPWAEFEGQVISKRDAVELFFKHVAANSGSDIPTISNGYIEGGLAKFLYSLADFPSHVMKWVQYANTNPASLGQTERTMFEQIKRYGSAGYKGSVDVLDQAWVRIVGAAHYAETGVRLAFWLSQFKPIGAKSQLANVLGSATLGGLYRYSDNFEKLVTKYQDAFINPNTMGWVPRTGNTWYGSFLQYTVKAPFNMTKAAMSNPAKLYHWHRLNSFFAEVSQIQEDPTEAQFTDWELRERPHYLGKTKDKYGQEHHILLFPQGYDTFSRMWTVFAKTGDAIQQAMGSDVSARAKLDEINGDGLDVDSFLSELVKGSGRLQQTIVEQLLGKDILTGQSLDVSAYEKRPSFLFFQPSPRARAIVESLIPGLGYLDDLNPFGVFGEPTIVDVNDNILRQGTPGLTGTERYPARALDRIRATPTAERFFYQAAKLAGLNVRLSPVAENIEGNLQDVSYAARTLETTFNKSMRELQYEASRGVIDQASWEARDKATSDILAQIYWLKNEEIRLTLMAGEYGALPPELQEDIYHLNVMTYTMNKGLPPAIHEDIVRMYSDIAEMWRQYEALRNAQTQASPATP